MTNSNMNGLRSDADDLVYRMRDLIGTGDIGGAAELVKESLELLNDASAYDRTLSDEDDDSEDTLTYVLNATHEMADTLKCIVPEA